MMTVGELRERLAREGVDRNAVMWTDEQGYRADGTWLVHLGDHGQCVIANWERGREWYQEEFPSEADAVERLADYLLPQRQNAVRPLSDEERATIRRRTESMNQARRAKA